jgi:hypothetical protein
MRNSSLVLSSGSSVISLSVVSPPVDSQPLLFNPAYLLYVLHNELLENSHHSGFSSASLSSSCDIEFRAKLGEISLKAKNAEVEDDQWYVCN